MSKKSKKHPRANAGYTLTELLVVLVILGLVMGLVAPRFIGQIGGAKGKTATAQIENLASAVEFFHLDTGRYPTTSDGLSALVTAPSGAQGWKGPYLRRGLVPDDPWGTPYQYQLLGDGQFAIRTLGRDQKQGGEGEDQDYVSGS
ncbi:MAG: type II secretion system major pseudopilin GspG [Robiginitomaculum sp.]|nr:type II secretion system major pseudopilin GspG [Robiginitomaculum sp.]